MSRTGTLLTDAERARFARWLNCALERPGVSKSKVAAALGDDSTQRLNRYLRGGVIPTPPVLGTIASSIGVPVPIALWQAGYYRVLLAALDGLSGYDDDLRDDVVRLALRAFPRRDTLSGLGDDGTAERALESSDWIPEFTNACDVALEIKSLKGLHPYLARASAALADSALDPATRRAVAAEYVHAWADEIAPAVAISERAWLSSLIKLLEAQRVPCADLKGDSK